ncbi:MAG: VWA domain-containing protein [Flavobacteriaceae bacterium]|nr:VWA domain-containing protein [Flavobacteriaceae bacterium]
MKWNNLEINNPEFLWLLILIPFLSFWLYYSRKKNKSTLTISSLKSFKGQKDILTRVKNLLPLLKIISFILLILALSRPRVSSVTSKIKNNEGIDIMMAMDVSASMLAKDLKPNRLEALKKVAINFVDKRPNDRIGIVVYAGESYTKTPITTDKGIIKANIQDITWGKLNPGTAIGMGLGSSVNRLKSSKAKSKVIILLTDGVNNTGFIDPNTATELATELGIKVYTIGIGTTGKAMVPYAKDSRGKILFQKQNVEIDEELLKNIASDTGGKYFRATSNSKLKSIYDEIDKLEKTELEDIKYYNYSEKYRILVIISLMLLSLEFLLNFTIFRSIV